MIRKFKKYENYQSTNINWIGELPSTWKLIRLGSVFEERRLKVSDKIFPPLSVTKNGVVPQLATAAKTNDGDNRKGVFKGDFVINSRSDRKGSSGLAKQNGSVSLINTVLKPVNIIPQFSEYLLRSYSFIEEFYRNGHGIVDDLWTTKYSEMKGIMIPLPSKNEQKAIATFLDHKTAQIAHYIQLKEKTIALLEERKAAIINQAVTKGLDADVKMKDSGIEWLGEVPEGWEVKKLWYLISYITSGSRGWGNYYSEKGAVFIRVGNISKNKDISLNLEDLIFVSPPSSSEGKRTLIALNDVLLAITGATIGSVALIDKDLGEAYVNQHTALMRPIKEKINPKWLAYSLLSEYCQTQIRLKSYGGTKEGLGLNEVRTFKILLPPLWVQDSIIHEIDDKIHEINNHISCVSKEITLIKEYRESLISAAVIGKIDVREYQPTASEYAAADNY